MAVFKKTNWLNSGDEAFSAMLAAIDAARTIIRFETYIYANDEVGIKFREAFLKARARGVAVKILVDGLGSFALPGNFWLPLLAADGDVRWFNPLGPKRFIFRNHRKLLVCDDAVAFIGGFNIAKEYQGDGVKSGWRDLGLQISSSLTGELVASFEEMFAHANFQHKRFMRLRKPMDIRTVSAQEGELLLSGPGRGYNPFNRLLRHDLAGARDVKIIAAYFLPTWRIRRDLARVVRRGGRVQLILAGKSDVFLSQLASRSLYRRLLKAGIEIYEYQPQILHAKLIVIDHRVYVGSSNLDPRSLHINYELMMRFENRALAAEARQLFIKDLALSPRIELAAWRKSGTWWKRLRRRWAYFILVELDPFIARWQYKGMLS